MPKTTKPADPFVTSIEGTIARLESDRDDVVAAMRLRIAGFDRAIASLRAMVGKPAAAPLPAAPARRAARPTKRRGRRPKPARKPALAKAAKSKRRAPGSIDEPVRRLGRLPTSGMKVQACSDETERKALVEKLRKEGLERVKPGARIVDGTFDVVDRNGEASVLWRPLPAAKAAA